MNVGKARGRCRVDFAGGTLDLWPLGLLHPGAVTVNGALELGVEVRIEPAAGAWEFLEPPARGVFEDLAEAVRHPSHGLVATVVSFEKLPPCRLEWRSESPRAAGLGASSALIVAALAAAELFRSGTLQRSPLERVRVARDLEARLLGLPTGIQDHLAATFGGLLALHHEPGGERVETIAVDLEELSRCLLVAYSGESHQSGATNWRVVRARLDGSSAVCQAFDAIAAAAQEARAAMLAQDWERLGRAVALDWAARSQFASDVSTPRIESLLEAAHRLGAWGGKACGAGGGGCVLALAPPERIPKIREAWIQLDAAPVAGARLSPRGLEAELDSSKRS